MKILQPTRPKQARGSATASWLLAVAGAAAGMVVWFSAAHVESAKPRSPAPAAPTWAPTWSPAGDPSVPPASTLVGPDEAPASNAIAMTF
jgi:hypothetical protein